MINPLVVFPNNDSESNIEALAEKVREIIDYINGFDSPSQADKICPQCKNVNTFRQSKSEEGVMVCCLCGHEDRGKRG